VREALRLYGMGLQAVLISGGGNDFAGFNDMRPLLKDNCAAETSAGGCFAQDGPDGLKEFLEDVDTSYRKLIGAIYTRTRLDCRIIMHSYDYAIPDGQGLFGDKAWLRPAMDDAGVPKELQRDCVVYLIDAFHDVLERIRRTDPTHLFIVDSRGTLDRADWANELHPTGAGFAKLARKCWRPVLHDLGLAA
jgi:hypothetical protein